MAESPQRPPFNKTASIYAMVATLALTRDWLTVLSVLVLMVLWHVLKPVEGPPVISLLVAYHWVQGTVGLFYYDLTGRNLPAILNSDYRRMVVLALIATTALGFGAFAALRSYRRPAVDSEPADQIMTKSLMTIYFGLIFANGTLNLLAWLSARFTQVFVTMAFGKLLVLFLIFRRFVTPDFQALPFFGILVFEIVLGLSGFFADFKFPMLVAALALIELLLLNRRSVGIWLTLIVVTIFCATVTLIWTEVKYQYRAQIIAGTLETRSARFRALEGMVGAWVSDPATHLLPSLDGLVDRLWQIYFPALALDRVPSLIPHTNGAILRQTIKHILTPRIFFPNKPGLPNESENVRLYAGVEVAGSESGTSHAFSYIAESYVDFGIPGMFAPIFVWGYLAGFVASWVSQRIRNVDIRIATWSAIAVFGFNIFERSWSKLAGQGLTFFILIGSLAIFADRQLRTKRT